MIRALLTPTQTNAGLLCVAKWSRGVATAGASRQPGQGTPPTVQDHGASSTNCQTAHNHGPSCRSRLSKRHLASRATTARRRLRRPVPATCSPNSATRACDARIHGDLDRDPVYPKRSMPGRARRLRGRARRRRSGALRGEARAARRTRLRAVPGMRALRAGYFG
jgi:hypothetical protein